MRARQSDFNAAVLRRLQYMNKLLSEGDIVGALNKRPHRTAEEEREEYFLPKPDAVAIDGARTWSF